MTRGKSIKWSYFGEEELFNTDDFVENMRLIRRPSPSGVQNQMLILFWFYRVLYLSIKLKGKHVEIDLEKTFENLEIDNKLNLDKHIASICKSSFFHFRNIARIRRFLSAEKIIALVHAFITCRLGNCNSLLYGLPKHLYSEAATSSELCCSPSA